MPLLWLSLAFMAGIVAADSLAISTAVWLGLAGAAGVVLGVRGRLVQAGRWQPQLAGLLGRLPPELRPPLPVFALVLAACLGGWRGALAQPALDPHTVGWYATLPQQPAPLYVIEGILVEPPDQRDLYTYLTVRVERLRPREVLVFTPASGKLLAQVEPGGDWRYGDRVRLRGGLEVPPSGETFSYRAYLARQGIYALMPASEVLIVGRNQGNPAWAALYALRRHLLGVVYRLYPEPEASLLAGILLGDETQIPAKVERAFQDTGTSHIVAISGFNMAVIAGVFTRLFGRWLGPRKGALAALAAIVLYTLLVGSGPPVVRAALLSILALGAGQVGRRQHGFNSLAFLAALMAAFDPNCLWDVGFQLSFLATLGLMLYAEPLGQLYAQVAGRFLPAVTVRRLAQPVSDYILLTLAAQITTLPLMLYDFQRLPLVALVVNPLILPVQAPLMMLGGLSVIFGGISLPVGQGLAYLAWPFVAFTIRLVEAFAQVPGGSLPVGRMSPAVLLGLYALIFGWTMLHRHFRPAAAALQPAWGLGFGAVVVVLVWRSVWSAPDGRLHLTILDVGSGDGLLVQAPGGGLILIDGGLRTTVLADQMERRMPAFARRLDWLVVAGTTDDQLGAAAGGVEQFAPEAVLWAGPTAATRSARTLQRWLAVTGVPVTTASAGQVLDLGQGARLEVAAVSGRGAVLVLAWDQFRAVLPVGPDFENFEELKARPDLAGGVLLLADNGYAATNPPDWIAALQPRLVLLSVGAGDYRGLPDPETLAAVSAYPLLRTDKNGWIEISTDGEQMWVEVERPGTNLGMHP